MEQNKINTPNTSKNKKGERKTTRQKMLAKLIQVEREDAIRFDLDKKCFEALINRLTMQEKRTLFAFGNNDASDEDVNNFIEQQLEAIKAQESVAIIKLETLKEIRDGKPEINTPENKKIVEESPVVRIQKKNK